jgi:Asp/Glu/hydantoin racemase
MTDILLINPNTTQSITDLVLRTARRFAAKGTRLRAVSGRFGPRYIASHVGYAIAGHAAVDALANDRGRRTPSCWPASAIRDWRLSRKIARVPVVGMADASILQACALGERFSIVTGGARWRAMLQAFVAAQGSARGSPRCVPWRRPAPTSHAIRRPRWPCSPRAARLA